PISAGRPRWTKMGATTDASLFRASGYWSRSAKLVNAGDGDPPSGPGSGALKWRRSERETASDPRQPGPRRRTPADGEPGPPRVRPPGHPGPGRGRQRGRHGLGAGLGGAGDADDAGPGVLLRWARPV